MNTEKYIASLKGLYKKYWAVSEIDVDLANSLADSVPKLIGIVESLQKENQELRKFKELAVRLEKAELERKLEEEAQ